MDQQQTPSPARAQFPDSPTASMKTNLSMLNLGDSATGSRDTQAFTSLPNSAQSPRINPSFSANDIVSLSNGAGGSMNPLGLRSSSMIFMPGSGSRSQPTPQPSLDGFEPRMFPGVVSRRRRGGAQNSENVPSSPAWARRNDPGEEGEEEEEGEGQDVMAEELDELDSDDE
jgi:hypothetical protein